MLTSGLGAVGIAMTFVSTLALVFIGELDLDSASTILTYLGPTTLITGFFCAWMCLRKERNKEDAARTCLTAGLFGGVLNTVLGYLAIIFVNIVLTSSFHTSAMEVEAFVVGFIVSALIGLIVGCPIGLIFSVAFLKPIKFACSHQRSHDSVERTGIVCGSWFALVGAICTALLLFASLCGTVDRIGGAVIAIVWCSVSAGLGLVVYALARIGGARRKRWLERVRCGEIAGWVLLPMNAQFEEMAEGLRPFLHSNDEPAMGILAQTKQGYGSGAYRRADHVVPVATVTQA